MSALESWRRRAIEEVTLPSGMEAQIRKPRTDELIRGGGLPPELRQAVLKVYSGSAKLEELSDDQVGAFLAEQDRLVAAMVVALRPDPDAEWEETHLSAEDVATLPPDDVEALRDIGNRQKTAESVTARSLMSRQLLERARALHIEEEAKPGTVPGWTDFRGQRRGAEPGADGEGVAPEAVGAAAPRRGRRRAGPSR